MYHTISTYFAARAREMASQVLELVQVESPTRDIAATTRCADFLYTIARADFGERVTLQRLSSSQSPAVRIEIDANDANNNNGDNTASDVPHVLLLGHFDTVHPIGTLSKFGARLESERVYGPGALDMKAGIVIILETLRYLSQRDDCPKITVFLSPDEEIGSPHSAAAIRAIAATADAGFVFEPASRKNQVKIGAQGARHFAMTFRGKGGHASAPQLFVNPIQSLAHCAVFLEELESQNPRATATPTVLHAGAATNAVPSEARMHIDVRSSSTQQLEAITDALQNYQCRDPRVSCSVETEAFIQPFPAAPANNEAYGAVCDAAQRLDVGAIDWMEALGASDTNTICDLLPDLVEGLGGWGAGVHAAGDEYVEIESLSWSAALAAGSVLAIRERDERQHQERQQSQEHDVATKEVRPRCTIQSQGRGT